MRCADRGYEFAEETTVYCPRCRRQPLDRCVHRQRAVALCPRCAGVWTAPTSWDRKRLGPLPDAGQTPAPGKRQGGVIVRPPLLCPAGHGRLTTVRIGGREGCDIDQCPTCGGIWFDHGEWEHLEALQAVAEQNHELDRPGTWKEWAFQFCLHLPVEFNVKPRRFPAITMTLVGICLLAYGWQWRAGPAVWRPWALPGQIVDPADWLTLVTSLFLHPDAWLLLGNLYFLYVLGDNVEDVLGRWKYLLFFLACGLTANGLWIMFCPANARPLAGGGGAVAGVMAAYLILFRQARLTFMLLAFQVKAPAWLSLGVWFAFQLIGAHSVLPADEAGLVFLAQLGGFAAGVMIILPAEQALLRRHPLLRLLRRRQDP